jgi:ParB/RepB/Spo0J family partition protein
MKTATKKKASAPTETLSSNGNGHLSTFVVLPVTSIVPSQLVPQIQRRARFKDEDITELAASIKAKGLINPITVRPAPGFYVEPGRRSSGVKGQGMINGFFWVNPERNDYVAMFNESRAELEATPPYEIVSGERRWLASTKAGLASISAVVRDLSDEDTLEVQLHENLKRVDVDPLDEALTYRYLIDEKGYTVQLIADKFGKEQKLIHRRLKLADLCEEAKQDLASGKLHLKQAELIARFPDDVQRKILKNDAYRWDDSCNSEKDLRSTLAYKYVLNLNSAPFDRSDASLHKDGLTCGACTRRTGHTPALFEDDEKLAKDDYCLQQSCWDGKVKTWLLKKRTDLARKLPNPNKLPIEELALKVPLVKEQHGQSNYNIGKGDYVARSVYASEKQFTEVEPGKECPKTETGLIIYKHYSKPILGTTLPLCRSQDCKRHKNKPAAENSSRSQTMGADHRKTQQAELDRKILERLRGPLLRDYVCTFNAERSVLNSEDLRKKLLTVLFSYAGWSFEDDYPEEILGLFPDGWDRNFDIKDLAKQFNKMDETEVSLAFAAVTFGYIGRSDYNEVPDVTEIRSIADELGRDFDILEAEARVEEVPDEHKEAAKAHLAKLVAGEKSVPPPVYWPKPAAEKKAAKTKEVANAG